MWRRCPDLSENYLVVIASWEGHLIRASAWGGEGFRGDLLELFGQRRARPICFCRLCPTTVNCPKNDDSFWQAAREEQTIHSASPRSRRPRLRTHAIRWPENNPIPQRQKRVQVVAGRHTADLELGHGEGFWELEDRQADAEVPQRIQGVRAGHREALCDAQAYVCELVVLGQLSVYRVD